MLDNHAKYLISRISSLRKELKTEPSDKAINECLIAEFIRALSKYTSCRNLQGTLNEYNDYLLDIIEEYEEDPEEKEFNEFVILELVQVLANYNSNSMAA